MASGAQAETIWCDGGGYAVVVTGEAGAGQERVDESEDASAFDESCGIATYLASEGDEDAVNFFLLLFEEADELVVLLDGFERLYVYGLA